MTATNPAQRLLVILDPEYGDQFREIWPGSPVWITMSCVNEPVIRSLWATRSEPNHLTGITGMRFDGDIAPEDHFLAELDAIDLHHGPYSTTSPYTVLEVIGAPLTNSIRAALSKIGFTDFTESQNRFAATRTAEEAMRLRD